MREQLKETIIPNFLKATQQVKQSDIEDALINAYLGKKDGNSVVKESIDNYGLSVDIETLTKNINEFEEQVNKAENLEDLGYLSDWFDMEKGLKHISIF
jgi:hypothetical protein